MDIDIKYSWENALNLLNIFSMLKLKVKVMNNCLIVLNCSKFTVPWLYTFTNKQRIQGMQFKPYHWSDITLNFVCKRCLFLCFEIFFIKVIIFFTSFYIRVNFPIQWLSSVLFGVLVALIWSILHSVERDWPTMYGSWIVNDVLWRIFLGFIWDMQNVLMMHNYQ